MAQHYSDPDRESDVYSLPDVETWKDAIVEVSTRCGVFEVCRSTANANPPICPSCDRESCFISSAVLDRSGWFYWFCLPGCMPDSEGPIGPFDTEELALADAREGMED